MPNEKVQVVGLAVFLGGALGGAARYALSLLPAIGQLPVITTFINCIGTFVLAALGSYMKNRAEQPAYLQAFIGTGLCGGFTTFGTFIMQDSDGLLNGNVLYALLLLLGTVVAALFFLFLGQRAGEKLAFLGKGGSQS